MVSLWPWRASEDAASFEKTLSTLTAKIQKAASSNETRRQRSRRVRVMWTLYAGFAYILAALLLLLVTGWQNWGAVEMSVVAGGPPLIYSVRTAVTSFFDYRISKTDAHLQRLNKERDGTIERLKEATKYNSTQQLLDKYGSAPKQKDLGPSGSRRKSQGPPHHHQAPPPGSRTGIAPPPTANIQRPAPPPQQPSTPQRPPPSAGPPAHSQSPDQLPPPPDSPTAEFAPNAFAPPELTRQYTASAPSTFTQPHWYDRILDALLGEDETQPKNRFALICTECRLVNGQAPPGARSLADVGRWRCGGCGAWNGEEKVREDDLEGLVQGWEAERRAREGVDAAEEGGSSGEEDAGTTDDEASETVLVKGGEDKDAEKGDPDEASLEQMPAKSTRSKTRGRGKGRGKK